MKWLPESVCSDSGSPSFSAVGLHGLRAQAAKEGIQAMIEKFVRRTPDLEVIVDDEAGDAVNERVEEDRAGEDG
jgi:hypothetical protein